MSYGRDYFEVAPDVKACFERNGDYLYYGHPSALVAAGLADPDWFAERPKRVKRFRVGGELVQTKMSCGWCYVSVISMIDPPAPIVAADDGRGKGAWRDCAWQPRATRKSSKK